MEKHVTATDAVRRFSEILNSVNYRGDRYVIMRGKKPVAHLYPHEEGAGQRVLGDLKSLMKHLPQLKDKEFADDVKKGLEAQPLPPADVPWE